MSALHEFLSRDRFAAASGVELTEVRAGYARAQLTIGADHFNSVGRVHGGAIFTLAATALFAACCAAGRVVLGINLNISYVTGAESGTLFAEAVEISRSRKIATCTVRVTDRQQTLVALLQGTAYITDQPISEAGRENDEGRMSKE